MAFKSKKEIYYDRPLLSEKELDFILYAVELFPVDNDTEVLLKDASIDKLHKSKRRINMLKLSK